MVTEHPCAYQSVVFAGSSSTCTRRAKGCSVLDGATAGQVHVARKPPTGGPEGKRRRTSASCAAAAVRGSACRRSFATYMRSELSAATWDRYNAPRCQRTTVTGCVHRNLAVAAGSRRARQHDLRRRLHAVGCSCGTCSRGKGTTSGAPLTAADSRRGALAGPAPAAAPGSQFTSTSTMYAAFLDFLGSVPAASAHSGCAASGAIHIRCVACLSSCPSRRPSWIVAY